MKKVFSSSVTVQEYHDAVSKILEKASNNSELWLIIMKNISMFQHVFKQLEEKCVSCCESMTEDEVMLICDVLRERISSFRKFRDADWSVPEDYVEKLEDLLLKITPNSIKKYQHLFKWYPNLLHPIAYDKESQSDYQKEQQLFYQTRATAMEIILKEFGIDEFIIFCNSVEDVGDMGRIVTEKLFNNYYDFELIQRIKESNYSLYASVLWSLFSVNGLGNLVDALNKNDILSNIEKGDILCQTPLVPELWEKISVFDEEIVCYYWEHVSAFRLSDEYKSFADYFINQLLKHNRPFSAIKIISASEYYNTVLIIQALEKCLELQEYKEPRGLTLNSLGEHDIVNLFEKIHINSNVDKIIIAKLEISFLSYFKYQGKPKCLIGYLEENPKEYITLISKRFRGDNDSEAIIDEERKNEAMMAYDILEHFKEVPGCNDRMLSEEAFDNWIDVAQNFAKEIGYSRAFEICLGRLLSYAPVGSDGIFPHEIVRNFFEKNASTIMVEDFLIAKRNQQGMHIVTGGIEEKRIAKTYHEHAKKIRITYPNTAAILDQLGDEYYREALYEEKLELLDFRE